MPKVKSFFYLSGKDWGGLILSALLMFLSFPWFKTGFLVFFSLIPMLFILETKPISFKTGFKFGYWYGVLVNGLVVYWIANNLISATIAVIIVNAFHFALLWGIFQKLKTFGKEKAYLIFPFIWVFMEYSRNYGDLKFNWLTLAHSLTYYISFIQPIEYTGMFALSFIIVIGNFALFYAFVHRKSIYSYFPIAVVATLIILWEFWGFRLLNHTRENLKSMPSIKIGIVQPNIDPWEKWTPGNQRKSMKILMAETRSLLKDSAQLIVWPETATPFYLRNRPQALDSIRTLLARYRVPLLTGTLDYELTGNKQRKYKIYNSAFFIDPFHPLKSYNKIKLVPGAEELPFKAVLGWISHYIDLGQGNFVAGDLATVFSFYPRRGKLPDSVRLACGICYDSAFPDLFRRYIQNGANVLSVITNDGWFGTTTGPYQHWQFSVLRAVETRRSIARSANTGISGFILPTGMALMKTKLEIPAAIAANVPLNSRITFYSKHGDVFPVFCGILSLLLLSLWRLNGVFGKTND